MFTKYKNKISKKILKKLIKFVRLLSIRYEINKIIDLIKIGQPVYHKYFRIYL